MGKKEVSHFYFNLEDNLFKLHHELTDKKYSLSGYESFYVRDPKLRPIHKAPVRDRLVFQAVFRVLYPLFDRKFIFDSYSCRFNKGTHRGVERLNAFLKKASYNFRKRVFVLKCDIRKFFYSIDHAILLDLLKLEVVDPECLELLVKIIDSFHVQPGKGLPLGNVTSQLFANVYLNELDQFVKHVLKEKYYIRYCDDFIIIGSDNVHLQNLISKTSDFLQSKLKLELHPDKVKIIKSTQGIDFLGYVTLPHYRVLRTKTKRRMLRRLSEAKNASQHNLQSYLGLLKHCKGKKLRANLSQNKACKRMFYF